MKGFRAKIVSVSMLCLLVAAPAVVGAEATSTGMTVKMDTKNVMLKLDSKQLQIEDSWMVMNSAPMLNGNVTYVPIEFWAKIMGGEIKWDQDARTATIENGTDVAVFQPGAAKDIVLNGTEAKGTNLVMDNDKIYVPLRYIAEWFGWTVQFNADHTIYLAKMMPADKI